MQQSPGARRGEHVLLHAGFVARSARVAMAPTTAATRKPICRVTMETVIPQKVGEGEVVRGGSQSTEGGDGTA